MSYPILETIESLADFKTLSKDKLPELCSEIRNRIIDVMSVNGGHLASNLGSVELLVAMHYVYSSPSDKFIYDTSHQIYTHKILTDRNDLFPSTRKYGGLSGFAAPCESPHDHFYSGHAGAALSAALGVATARDLNKEDFHVLPFVCDAPFACGLTFEALNNIPKNLSKFCLILNDNAWAISSGVGAMYNNVLGSFGMPREKMKEAQQFFGHFHLEYTGPIDGHNVLKVVETLREMKNKEGPLILHALTVKGHGMERAKEDPTTYHGVIPFDPESGKFHPTPAPKVTFPKVFGKELLAMANEDEDIVTITPAMPRGSCLDAFMQTYPDRSFDVGIAEGHAISFAGGLTYKSGKKVIASVYATFFQRALDNVFQEVALQKLPVVFALDRAGFSARDGSSHHGIYDISFLNAMPGMVIAQPRDGDILRDLMHSAFNWKRPVAIRYPNMGTASSERAIKPIILGKGEILSQGSQIAIISLGHMNKCALEVQTQLRERGLDATVVDPIFVKPLDRALLFSLLDKHHAFVTIEEHAVNSGLGACVNSFVTSNDLSIRVLNFGIPDYFVEHGSYQELIEEVGLTAEKITNQIVNTFAQKAQKLDTVEV